MHVVQIMLRFKDYIIINFDGLVQDCSISIANALEILQSCTKPSIYGFMQFIYIYSPGPLGSVAALTSLKWYWKIYEKSVST